MPRALEVLKGERMWIAYRIGCARTEKQYWIDAARRARDNGQRVTAYAAIRNARHATQRLIAAIRDAQGKPRRAPPREAFAAFVDEARAERAPLESAEGRHGVAGLFRGSHL